MSDGFRVLESSTDDRITEAGVPRVTERFTIGASSLTGTATLSAEPTATILHEVELVASSTMTAAASKTLFGSTLLSGIGTVTTIGSKKVTGLFDVTGTSHLAADGSKFQIDGATSLFATGTIASLGSKRTFSGADLSATSSKVSAGVGIVFGAGLFTGTGSASFVRKYTGKGEKTFEGSSSLSSLASKKTLTATDLTGIGTISVIGSELFTGATSLTGSSSITANALDTAMYIKQGGVWKTSIPYVKTYKATETTRTYTVRVVADGGNKYRFNDSGINAETITLREPGTYTFDQSDGSNSGHPLRFSTTSNGTHGGGTEYTTGVTVTGVPGTAGAKTVIVIEVGAPTLYYYCTAHSGMGGKADTDTTVWEIPEAIYKKESGVWTIVYRKGT